MVFSRTHLSPFTDPRLTLLGCLVWCTRPKLSRTEQIAADRSVTQAHRSLGFAAVNILHILTVVFNGLIELACSDIG